MMAVDVYLKCAIGYRLKHNPNDTNTGKRKRILNESFIDDSAREETIAMSGVQSEEKYIDITIMRNCKLCGEPIYLRQALYCPSCRTKIPYH